jgi:MoxR-like ATPase
LSQTGDLSLILNARIPILSIESADEQRVVALLGQLAKDRGIAALAWTATHGLRSCDGGASGYEAARHTDPEVMLRHIAATEGPAWYLLCDLAPYLAREPRLVRYVKDIAQAHERLGNTLLLLDDTFDVPSEIAAFTASFALHLPSDEELRAMIRAEALAWVRQKPGRKVRTDADALDKLTASLRGTTQADAEQLIRRSLFADEATDDNSVAALNRLKFHLMDGDGVLRYEHNTESFASVAGLHVLRAWLELRRRSVAKAGRNRPKGLLLLGVKGSGKSLAARAAAGLFGLPLLRLDFGVLYNKSIPRMERNLRNALRQAELMAPCVLWMDEIERGFAARNTEPEASERMVGTLLTWMAENTKPVFLIATSNDATELPNDLIRKGRLDEVFFVDLPDAATRAELFRVHMQRRDLDPQQFDLDSLAAASEGFTGAEIESAIVVSHYLAASRRRAATAAEIVAALRRTNPLAALRADEVERLRGWAKERTAAA